MLYSPQPRTLFPYSAVLLVFHSRDDEGKQFEGCEWVEGCDGNIPSRIRIRIPANALLSLSLSLSLVLISLSPSRFTVFGFFSPRFQLCAPFFFPPRGRWLRTNWASTDVDRVPGSPLFSHLGLIIPALGKKFSSKIIYPFIFANHTNSMNRRTLSISINNILSSSGGFPSLFIKFIYLYIFLSRWRRIICNTQSR